MCLKGNILVIFCTITHECYVFDIPGDACNVDTRGVVAKGHSSLEHTATCRDDDAGMVAVTGVTCERVKMQSMCGLVTRGLLPNLCTSVASPPHCLVVHAVIV